MVAKTLLLQALLGVVALVNGQDTADSADSTAELNGGGGGSSGYDYVSPAAHFS
jgi:hypothetical protein